MDALRQDVPVTWSLPAVLVPEAGDRGFASAAPEALAQRTWPRDACIELAGSVDPTTPVRHSIAGAGVRRPRYLARHSNPRRHAGGRRRRAHHDPGSGRPDIPEHPSGAELTTATPTIPRQPGDVVWKALPPVTTDGRRRGLHHPDHHRAAPAADRTARGCLPDGPDRARSPDRRRPGGTTGTAEHRPGRAGRHHRRLRRPRRCDGGDHGAGSEDGQFGTGAQGADWCTCDISTSPRNSTGPTVVSDVAGVLALTSGRADIARLYRNGSLRLQDIPGLRWVAVVEEVPSLPGGATLARAGRYLAGISSLVSVARRPGRRRPTASRVPRRQPKRQESTPLLHWQARLGWTTHNHTSRR